MSWNYRVIRENIPDSHGNVAETFGIHEVYYDSEGIPKMCSEAIEPYGETMEELQWVLKKMSEALHKPILEMELFNKTT